MKTKILSSLGTTLLGLSFLEVVSYGVGLIGAILFAAAQYYSFQKNRQAHRNEVHKSKMLENLNQDEK